MTLPLVESFGAGAGVLGNPPWTQQETTTVNTDGSGRGKASGANASLDLGAFDNSNTYAAAQYAQQTIVSGLANSANYAIVYVRMSGTGGSKNGYYLTTDGVNGAGHTAIGKYVAGVQTELLALSPAAAFTSGDVMRLEVSSGFLLTAYKNGVAIGSTTDGGSSLASGAAGCGMYNQAANNVLIDDWQGGDFSGGAGAGGTYTGVRRRQGGQRGPFDRRGLLVRKYWDYTFIAAVIGAFTLTPDTGVLQVDGYAPSIGTPVTITPATGQLTLAGFAPQFPTTVVPGSGALSLTGFSPTIGLPRTIVPGFGQLSLTGFPPSIGLPKTIVPGVGAFDLNGFAPTFARTIKPGFAQLVLDGFAPAFTFVSGAFTLQPGLGALSLTGFSPTIGLPQTLRPGVGALDLTGFAPQFARTIVPGFGDLALNGFAPSITFVTAGFTLQPGFGALALTGLAPTIGLPRTLRPGFGVLDLTGYAPALGLPITLRPGFGQLTLTGFGPVVSFFPIAGIADFTGEMSVGPRFTGEASNAPRFTGETTTSAQFSGRVSVTARFSGILLITPLLDGEMEVMPG